jgi:hypothetical protein
VTDAFDAKPTLRERVRTLGEPFVRESGPLDGAAARLRRPFDRRWYARKGGLDALARLGADVERAAPRASGPRVLVVSLRSWTTHAATEGVIALALRMRGADVALLTCGGGLPICEMGWPRKAAPRPCDVCAHFTGGMGDAVRLPRFSVVDGLPWGRDPRAAPARPTTGTEPDRLVSAAWFVKSADVGAAPGGERVAADFAVSGEGVSAAVERVLDRFDPQVVFGLNGLFDAERAIMRAAEARGLRTPTYEMAPRAGAMIFAQDSRAPDMDTAALWEAVRDRPLEPEQERAVGRLLSDRVSGVGAHETYFEVQLDDAAAVRRELGVPDGARVVSAFTNLAWDSALLGKDIAFPSMFDWLARAVQAVAARPDWFLVVRVHPAEVRHGTGQPAVDELAARVGSLPPNVRLVGPSEAISSYAVLGLTDLVLAYTSTVGLEAAVRGIPVAVAGSTHYRGRGFTVDLDADGDLERVLDAPPARDEARAELARRYAFTYFFRFMTPFPAVRTEGATVVGVPAGADALQPGRDPYLDLVCDRILDGGAFTVPDELAAP